MKLPIITGTTVSGVYEKEKPPILKRRRRSKSRLMISVRKLCGAKLM